MKIPIVGYLRCSTDRQETSVEDQRESIRLWAEAENREVVDWFIDEGISGTTAEKRPAFMRMVHLVESGQNQFREIACYSVNRFGRFRNRADSFYYLGLLGRADVPMRFVTNPSANMADLSGNLHLLVDSETARKFSEDQSGVVLRGSITNAKRGFSSGGIAPFGYCRGLVDETGMDLGPLPDGQTKANKMHRIRWTPDSEERVATVRRIFEMFGQDRLGLKQIAQTLNTENAPTPNGKPWHPTTVRSLLSNPVYVGIRRYCKTTRGHFQTDKWKVRDTGQWIVKEDAHTAIVDRELFETVQGILAVTKARFKGPAQVGTMRNGNYLLTSLLFCADCGSRMHGRTWNNGTGKVYRAYEESTANPGLPIRCGRFRIDSEGMEDAVLTVLADTLNPGLSQKRMLSLIRKELKAQLPSPGRTNRESGKMVADIDTKIQRIKQAIMAGVSPETFVGELAELNRLKAEHESRPKDPASPPVQTVDLERLAQETLEYLSDLRRALGQMDRIELKRTLQEMVDKIEIDKAGKRGFVYIADLPGVADPLGKSETFTHLSGRNRPPALIYPLQTDP